LCWRSGKYVDVVGPASSFRFVPLGEEIVDVRFRLDAAAAYPGVAPEQFRGQSMSPYAMWG
jgi:hypothetical protein